MVSVQPHPFKAYSLNCAPGQPAVRTNSSNNSAAFDNERSFDMLTHQQAPVQHMWQQQQQQQQQFSPGMYGVEPGCAAAGFDPYTDTCRGQYSQSYRSPIAPAARMGCGPGVPAGFPMPPMPRSPLQYTAQQPWRLPSASQQYMIHARRQQQQQQRPAGLLFNSSTAVSPLPAAEDRAAPFQALHAHPADVWQRSEPCATAAEHALQASLTMSAAAAAQGYPIDRTRLQPPPLVVHQELQQLLAQQQQQQRQCLRTAGMGTSAPPAGQQHFSAPQGTVLPPGRGVQVVRRPACKRKSASLLQGNTGVRPVHKRPHASGLWVDVKEDTAAAAAAAAAATGPKPSDSPAATSEEVAVPAGCFALASHGDIAALLGAGSSDQAATQLHNMSRHQLFAFAAQVVAATGSADLCSSDGEGSSAAGQASPVLPPSSILASAGVRSNAGLCEPVECSNHCATAGAAAGTAAGAACHALAACSCSQGLDEVLLPAVQLEDFYSKPMSPAEAAAEAAAVAKAIVAAAKAAAAERVHSSRSCSPASPETFEPPLVSGGLGRQSSSGLGRHSSGGLGRQRSGGVGCEMSGGPGRQSSGSLGRHSSGGLGRQSSASGAASAFAGTPGVDAVLCRDAPQGTAQQGLLVPCQPPQALGQQRTGSGSLLSGLQLSPTAATSSRLVRSPEQQQQQQQSAMRAKASGTTGSACFDVRVLPVSAQDPSGSAAAEGSLELGCNPSSSQTGHGFETSLGLGLGLVQDESFVWQAESTAAWGLSDLSDLGFD